MSQFNYFFYKKIFVLLKGSNIKGNAGIVLYHSPVDANILLVNLFYKKCIVTLREIFLINRINFTHIVPCCSSQY